MSIVIAVARRRRARLRPCAVGTRRPGLADIAPVACGHFSHPGTGQSQGNRRAWERRSCARHLFVPALSAWSHGGCERAKRPWPKRRLRRPAN